MNYLLNKQVKHKKYGIGTVIEQNKEIITVDFETNISKFQYQDIERYLVPVDDEVLKLIKEDIAAINAAKEVEKKKLEEERQKLKDQKSQDTLRKKNTSSKVYKSVERVVGEVRTYLVFQGETYLDEFNGKFIWAPKYNENKNTFHHWDKIMDVCEGDLIFHCVDGFIQAISRARGRYVDSPRPSSNFSGATMWGTDGRIVYCDYYKLDKPIKHGDYKDVILDHCDTKYAPFNRNGTGNMGYLFDLNLDLASFFINEIIKKNPEVANIDYIKFLLI